MQKQTGALLDDDDFLAAFNAVSNNNESLMQMSVPPSDTEDAGGISISSRNELITRTSDQQNLRTAADSASEKLDTFKNNKKKESTTDVHLLRDITPRNQQDSNGKDNACLLNASIALGAENDNFISQSQLSQIPEKNLKQQIGQLRSDAARIRSERRNLKLDRSHDTSADVTIPTIEFDNVEGDIISQSKAESISEPKFDAYAISKSESTLQSKSESNFEAKCSNSESKKESNSQSQTSKLNCSIAAEDVVVDDQQIIQCISNLQLPSKAAIDYTRKWYLDVASTFQTARAYVPPHEQTINQLRMIFNAQLMDIQSKFEISACLDAIISKVEITQADLFLHDLKSRATVAQQESYHKSAVFAKLTPMLTRSIAQTQERVANVKSSIQQQQGRRLQVQSQLQGAVAEESAAIALNRRKHQPTDLRLLPKVILRHLVSFCSKEDIAIAIQVCHRWKFVLDRGYIWKAVAATYAKHLNANESKKDLHDSEVATIEAFVVPTSVTLTISDDKVIRNAGAMTKEKIFEACKNQIHNQVNEAQSSREDLSFRSKADKQIKEFLEQQIKQSRNKLGELMVERMDRNQTHSKIMNEKKHYVKITREMEAKNKDEESKREQLTNKSKQSIRAIEHKIKMLQDVQRLADTTIGSNANISEQIDKLNSQKKVLVKGVKQLRSDIKLLGDANALLLERLRKHGISIPEEMVNP